MFNVFIIVKSVRGYEENRTPSSVELEYIAPEIDNSYVDKDFHSMAEYMTEDFLPVIEEVDYRFRHGDVVGVVEYNPEEKEGEIIWDAEEEETALSLSEALEDFD